MQYLHIICNVKLTLTYCSHTVTGSNSGQPSLMLLAATLISQCIVHHLVIFTINEKDNDYERFEVDNITILAK
jgi:hypothetical protein